MQHSNCDESNTMSAEASSPGDDGTRETNTFRMDSYHGVQKDGEAVHRRRTMETNEPTPIRAAILHGRVGRRRRTTEDGEGGERDGVGAVEDEEIIAT